MKMKMEMERRGEREKMRSNEYAADGERAKCGTDGMLGADDASTGLYCTVCDTNV